APRTRTGFRPLTPEYASPEQVSGDPITTASDIYQLGLVLYRLLTGSRPFSNLENRKSLEEAITETRPVKPSELVGTNGSVPAVEIERKQLVRRLRGDLDTIVLKALRKDPSRRYGSASEMADDVRRHLQGRPIHARQDSRIYRGRKFLQRNTWIIPVVAGLAGATGLYIGTLIRHGNQMEVERNTAQREAAKATATQDFLVGLFQSADPFSGVSESRQDVLVTDIMDVGANRARSEFADQPELESLMLGTIGDVFLGLGDPKRARSLRDEAYQVAGSAFGYNSPQAVVGLRRLVEPTIHSARLVAGVADSAVLIAVQAVAAARGTFGENHLETARAEIALARAHMYSTSFRAAEPTLMHVIRKLRQSDWEASDELAEALMTLGRVLISTASDRWPEAAVIGSEAIEMYERSYGPEHVRTWTARVWLARTNDDPGESRRILEEAIVVFEEQLGRTHDMTIRANQTLAGELTRQGKHDDAAAAYRSTLDRRTERDGTQGYWYFITARGWADALADGGRYAEAAEAYSEAADAAEAAVGTVEASSIQVRRAWSLLRAGDLPEALTVARLAHEQILQTGSESLSQWDRCVLARALRADGRKRSADSLIALAATAIHPDHLMLVSAGTPCYGEFPPN
ncbi:MAG: tetratricopeptide repeat-containing protein kinase family protein, partial [Gemmatimonadota bacterium]